MAERPLSPHFTVYRFAYTMLLSFAHRLTGIALAVGLLAFCGWLMAAAGGPATYARYVDFLGMGVLQFVLAAWLVALVFHFANGIRHLCWDWGVGLERTQARRSAAVVIVGVVLVSAALLYLLFAAHGSAQ